MCSAFTIDGGPVGLTYYRLSASNSEKSPTTSVVTQNVYFLKTGNQSSFIRSVGVTPPVYICIVIAILRFTFLYVFYAGRGYLKPY